MSPDRTRRQEKVVTAKALLIVRAEVADPADRRSRSATTQFELRHD